MDRNRQTGNPGRHGAEARRTGKPPSRSPHSSEQRRSPAHAGGNAALLYGLHPVAAAWTNPKRKIRRLFATESGLASLAEAIGEASRQGLPRPQPTVLDRHELERMLPAGAVHQGLALDAAPLPEPAIEDICETAAHRDRDIVVLLDQVTDPHNVGAILRSAAAFGVSALVLPERNAPDVTGTLAKSASGAVEVVPLVRIVNLARTLGQLQQAGYWCVGLDASGTRTLAQMDLKGKVALVLGAEGSGLRRLTMERCDDIARLPTGGPIGSLNVSNAAAVAIYELCRA